MHDKPAHMLRGVFRTRPLVKEFKCYLGQPYLKEIHTLEQLKNVLSREWDRIPQVDIYSILLSVPRKRRAVVNARGGHTLYCLMFLALF